MSLFKELKRRNVFRVLLAYVVFAWLALQVADVLQSTLELPPIWAKGLLGLLAIGLIPALLFSWAYEITPEGLKREADVRRDASITTQTARKLDLVVIVLLVVAIGLFVVERFVYRPTAPVTVQTTVAEAPAQPGSDVPVVAVLPLKALSTGEEGTFLASGLHDDLLTKLAKLQAFKVISRTSVMEYVDTIKNMRDIGRELGAGFIVEGGLQAIGGRVSINAQLINAETDEHLWAETFNRELTPSNLFDVQSEIAGAIANALHATLSPGEVERLRSVPTENLEAYRAYLRGLDTHAILTKPALLNTVAAFSEAVRLDPEFAEAWALLARAYLRRYWEEGGEYDANPDPALLVSAQEALARAESLDPENIEIPIARAFYHYYAFREYEPALDELARAEAIAPYDHLVVAMRGFLLRRLGKLQEAAEYLLRALQFSPNNLGHTRETIVTLFDAGRCTEAATQANNALKAFPGDSGITVASAVTKLVCEEDADAARGLTHRVEVTTPSEFMNQFEMLLHLRDYDAAIEKAQVAESQLETDPLMQLTIRNVVAVLTLLGGREEAWTAAVQAATQAAGEVEESGGAFALQQLAMEAALRGEVNETVSLGRRGLEAFPRDRYLKPVYEYRMLQAYALAGAQGAAWDLFEDWAPSAWYTELYLVRLNPLLDTLRADPRFEHVYRAAMARYPDTPGASSVRPAP